MVNTQTGDYTYNMPLLEVPNPDGGYPLSLSYHAGIQTNEDASWVGLGWTLNPGSITRSVNGYPDDWQSQTNSSHVYWNGGTTTSYNVGVNVGLANTPATVGFGLSFSQDTYRGFGMGYYASVGGSFGFGPLRAGVGFQITGSPYGDVSYGVSASVGLGGTQYGIPASVGMNISSNFQSLKVGFRASSLGVSLSTAKGSHSFSVEGIGASVSNSKAGNVSTSSHGFHVDIPVYEGISISLGYSKTRYWTDETVDVTTHGSLYSSGYQVVDNVAYDEFSLLEDPSYKNIVDYPDPTVVQGGSFPDFDVYSVNAQGLSGNMRPYLLQGGILNQNILNGSTRDVTYYSPGVTNSQPYYRFEDDFSNSYQQKYLPYPDPTLNLRLVPPPLDGQPAYGNNDGTYGYAGGNALAGSKHVDIGVKVKPLNDLGYNSGDRLQSGMIEGYSITNESGMTYQFGLPAYSYGEENYQQNTVYNNGYSYNRLTRPAPYAYTWYLTTITGPDYVDRNNDQKADDGDWGYWVNFEYGKWSNEYVWRNPSEGFNMDEDNQFEDCSLGYKEVYYLNAIRTRTNVALFEKDLRQDAKGESYSSAFQKGYANVAPASNNSQSDYYYAGIFDVTSAQSLQLSHIYLLNAADENFVTPGSGPSNAYIPAGSTCPDCALSANVLDRTDVDAVGRAALEAKAIRVIDFDYDYSLCPGTDNSFDSYGTGSAATKNGKLTLNHVVMRGKGGANLLPPTGFGYDLTGTDANPQTATMITNTYSFTIPTQAYQVGDLINEKNPQSGLPDIFLGSVRSISGTGPYTYTMWGGAYAPNPVQATVYATKNPPYSKEAYDMWGMYKDDVNGFALYTNENLARFTSAYSARSVDAWSLRTITTPLGSQIKVNYESDTYKQPALDNRASFLMSNITTSDRQTLTFDLQTYSATEDPTQIVPVGTKFNPVILLVQYGNTSGVETGSQLDKVTQTNLGNLTITGYNPSPPGLTGHFTGVLDVAFPQYATVTIDGETGSEPASGVYTGNIYQTVNTDSYGGGVRVASMSINNTTDGSVTTTAYSYNDPTGRSSGITSYLPTELDVYDANAVNSKSSLFSYPNLTAEIKTYKETLFKNASTIYSLAREIPAPGVMYQYVTVTNQVQSPVDLVNRTVTGSTQYQFEVFNPNMIGIADVTARTNATNSFGTFRSRNMVLQKFTSSIGNLLRSVTYDGNGKILSETINHYLHDPYRNDPTFSAFMTDYKSALAQYYYQGFVEERCSEVKEVTNQPSSADDAVLATLSAREEYPCIQTGQTVINYVNGTQTSSQNLAFDFYSGQVTQTLETDAYGNNFLTQTEPAYRAYNPAYPTVSMGLKINNDNNLNMLTQTAGTYKWKVDGSNNKLGLVTATVNTWGNTTPSMGVDGITHIQNGQSENGLPNGNVWRQEATYNWLPTGTPTSDGLTPFASFTDFNWGTPGSSDGRWVNTSTTTMYDVFSKSLEVTDINNNYEATRLNYGEQRVILSGGPANYYEIAYSGAEDAAVSQTSGSFVTAAGGTIAPGVAHTGANSLLLGASGQKGFLYSVPIVSTASGGVLAGRNYTASVWVQPASGTMSGVKLYYSVGGVVKNSSLGTSSKTAGNWTLVNLTINGSDLVAGSTLNVWCENDNTSVPAYVDDMRFQPLNAATTAYVYDPFSGDLTDILDNSNLYTRFVYDASGRLVQIYKEKLSVGEFKATQYQYNYSATKFGNDPIPNLPYIKNNCPVGYEGSVSNVTTPANTYSSFISQADADAQANIYAQDYANTHGNCTCLPNLTWAGGVNGISNEITLNGTRVNYFILFSFANGNTAETLGTVSNCVAPIAQRTIPMTINKTSVYNLTVWPTGQVSVQWFSGPYLTGTVGLTGTYDLDANLAYSALETQAFQTSCPSGQSGSFVTDSVYANAFAADNQTDANNLAIAYLQANGPAYANSNGTCTQQCTLDYTSTWSSNYQGTVAVNTATKLATFTFVFAISTYTTGSSSLGELGGCKPNNLYTYTLTDGISGSTWTLRTDPSGGVTVQLTNAGPHGSGGTLPVGTLISLTGTYTAQ